MSDPVNLAKDVLSQANPANSLGPLLESFTKALIPYVDMVSNFTTSKIVQDPALAFYVTFCFMVSLIIILLAEKAGWTRVLRFTAFSAHYALLRLVRAMITIGLFFVGRRLGGESDFSGAFGQVQNFMTTTVLTWFLQKMIEWFFQVGPHRAFLYGPHTFDPAVDADSWFSSIVQVAYDYLKLYNELVLNSLIGGYSPSSNTGLMDLVTVTGDSSKGAAAPGRIRTLYQAYQTPGSGAGAQTQLEGASEWYNSPLFAGVFDGLVTRY